MTMEGERYGFVAIAVLCVTAVGVSAATLDATVTTDPADVFDVDHEGLPVGQDAAGELLRRAASGGDSSDTALRNPSRGGTDGDRDAPPRRSTPDSTPQSGDPGDGPPSERGRQGDEANGDRPEESHDARSDGQGAAESSRNEAGEHQQDASAERSDDGERQQDASAERSDDGERQQDASTGQLESGDRGEASDSGNERGERPDDTGEMTDSAGGDGDSRAEQGKSADAKQEEVPQSRSWLDRLLSLLWQWLPLLVVLAGLVGVGVFRSRYGDRLRELFERCVVRVRALIGITGSDEGSTVGENADTSADGGTDAGWPGIVPSNEVDRAWFALVDAVEVTAPASKTPAECAAAAVAAGMDPDAVTELTRLFRRTHYGPAPVTETEERRARRLRRRLHGDERDEEVSV